MAAETPECAATSAVDESVHLLQVVPLHRSLNFVSQSTIWPEKQFFKNNLTIAVVYTTCHCSGSSPYTFPLC